jgi:hypothetical protein
LGNSKDMARSVRDSGMDGVLKSQNHIVFFEAERKRGSESVAIVSPARSGVSE